MVLVLIVDEIIPTTLVRTMGRDETIQVSCFQKGIVLPAAVARVGHAVLPDQSLFPQLPLDPFYDILKLLVVLPVGMVGPNVRDYVVGGIDGKLGEVVQLPGLAGLYTDPCIGVRRTVMGLVAGILAALVARSRPLVLVF